MEPVHIVLLVYAVVGGLGFGIFYHLRQRRRRALEAPIPDDRCVACGSRDLAYLDIGVYRCNACAYEGGSGVARKREEARRRQIAALDSEVRYKRGVASLLEARTILLALSGDLPHLLALSSIDIFGLGHDERDERKFQEMEHVYSEILRAHDALHDAVLCLGPTTLGMSPRGADDDPVPEIDLDATDFVLDHHFDNPFSDLKVHGEIKKMVAYAEEMTRTVEDAVERLGLSPPH